MTNKRRSLDAGPDMRWWRAPAASEAAIALASPAWLAVVGLVLLTASAVSAAETSYPFEGTWIRAELTCSAATERARIYTAKEVVSPRGRCAVRRVAGGASLFELLEDCRRNDRPMTVTETIRMTSPDSMTLKRQLTRLKIPRQIRYTRCSIAAPVMASPPRPTKPVAPAPTAETKKP